MWKQRGSSLEFLIHTDKEFHRATLTSGFNFIKTMKTLKYTGMGLSLMLMAGLIVSFTNFSPLLASAPSGLPANVATTSALTIGVATGSTVAMATSTNCAARIITTAQEAITVTFSDYAGDVPTGTFGHLQNASTTVAYDGGIYGCNAIKIFGFGTQLVTVTETR